MTIKLANIVAPAEFMITDTGQIYIYVSDVIADTDGPSKAALEWACAAVNDEEQEHNLAFTLDLAACVTSNLEFYNEGTGGEMVLPLEAKPQFDVLRAQLEAALRVFDRVTWIG